MVIFHGYVSHNQIVLFNDIVFSFNILHGMIFIWMTDHERLAVALRHMNVGMMDDG